MHKVKLREEEGAASAQGREVGQAQQGVSQKQFAPGLGTRGKMVSK